MGFFITAQTKPEWTNTQKNTISSSFYYGIGTSQVSSDEADTRAFFVAGNISIPEYSYSTFSFYCDKRMISIGATTYPFYSQFKNHFGFVIEANMILDKDFRNSRGNTFVLNGGVRLQASELFSTQLVYEDYEQLNLTFEFQF